MEATITIKGVETKEGVSQKTNKPWKLFKVKDEQGNFYSTFDQGMGHQAESSLGKVARIGYEQTEKGRNLQSLHITNDTPAPQPVSTTSPDGQVDWDRIGLQKTRCALWVAAIGAGLPVPQARSVVADAEYDIFHREPANTPEAGIPF